MDLVNHCRSRLNRRFCWWLLYGAPLHDELL
nr:MAG TPA: hypothetical protein [Caudoviricetes sp.]